MTQLKIFNSLSKTKEQFVPADATNIKLYVCGPTVYDYPHIGNGRSAVVYDLLYRILCHMFNKNVTYVRNITDVDDKINARAKELDIDIKTLTEKTTNDFHTDMNYLLCLSPTHEPKATENIDGMISIIDKLLQNNHAYISNNHIYFHTESFKDYCNLSSRNLDDMIAGVRIEVAEGKKHPADFVLWKPAKNDDDISSIFKSPWGFGRPGWHIECSTMSHRYLGENFDIHGGGADLIFPHHTNEIAQSCCAFPESKYARYWVHNGFLTVNGEKMSKSLGNFITIRDLANRSLKGEAVRYMMLSTHYRKPLDFTQKSLDDAKISLDYLYRALDNYSEKEHENINMEFLEILLDDLNSSAAFAHLHNLAKNIHKENDHKIKRKLQGELKASAGLMGFLQDQEWFGVENAEIDALIEKRIQAKNSKNWAEADNIRTQIEAMGIILEDTPNGNTIWRKK
jgi:cysteinyl-tRNA synthetase